MKVPFWSSISPRKRKWLRWGFWLIVAYTIVGFLILPPIVRSIAVKQLLQLPDHFYVINVHDGVAYFSRLVWNDGLEIGIKIESVVQLNARDDYLTSRLKKLWLSKAPG